MEGSLFSLSFYVFLSASVTLPLSALCTVSIEHFLWVLVPFCGNMIILEELAHTDKACECKSPHLS